MTHRRAALERARLYLICDVAQLARAPVEAVDILQLREKGPIPPGDLLAAARSARDRCAEHGVLFVVNDDPELAVAAGADGVHVGQLDTPVDVAREIVGPDLLIGLSTHTPDQIDAAVGADYIGVGPVHATPTKPGRPAAGLELVRYAAAHARVPFFAIGGIDPGNVAAVRAAGARGIAVVRAIAAAEDPAAAARALRSGAPDAVRAVAPAEDPAVAARALRAGAPDAVRAVAAAEDPAVAARALRAGETDGKVPEGSVAE